MELIDTQEASKLLGITQRTVSVWLKQNKLPGIKIGQGRKSEWRLNRQDLLEYLRKQSNQLQRQIEEERWKRHLEIMENAPESDEELTEEEIEGIEEGKKAFREGRVKPWEKVEEELGL